MANTTTSTEAPVTFCHLRDLRARLAPLNKAVFVFAKLKLAAEPLWMRQRDENAFYMLFFGVNCPFNY